MGMVREMSLDQMYTPHTTVEEREKGCEEQDEAMGWLGGAQVELLDFCDGYRCAYHLHGLCSQLWKRLYNCRRWER